MKKGFTLIELVVVVLIIGIIAGIGVPAAIKTVETSRAHNSVAYAYMVATGVRMFRVDYPANTSPSGRVQAVSLTGTETCADFSNTANKAAVADLIKCKFMNAPSWLPGQDDDQYYYYYACNGSSGGGCCSAGATACATRNPDADEAYRWTYVIDSNGACTASGSGAPACPKI